MAWFYVTAGALDENEIVKKGTDVWDKEVQLMDGLLLLLFPAQCCTEFLVQSYSIQEGFACLMRAQQRVRCVFNQPDSYESLTLKDLEEFMLSTFCRGDALKE